MNDQDSVMQVLEGYKAAVYAKDVDAFADLYDENVHVFDMWDRWSYQGIGAWRAMAQEWFGSLGNERVKVEMSDVRLTVTPKLACASALVKYAAISAEGAVLRWLQNRMTVVLEPRAGQWKIVHEHTSAPAESGTLKVLLGGEK